MALPQQQTPLQIERYVKATSLEEAVRALAAGDGTPVAGGTDLWIQKDEGAKPFGGTLVNVRRVPEIAGLSEKRGRIRLGALVTMTEILESKLLRNKAPVLPAAADRFGSDQIRNAATVGGNIANASPAADMVIPLMCLDAEVELAAWKDGRIETRRVALAEMFTGPGRTVRAPGELVTGVEFETPKKGFHAVFCKTGPRPALEIALVSLGLAGYLRNGALSDVRLALGAVAPTPVRCPETEAVLDGKALDDAVTAHALEALDGEIRPIDDVRGSTWYRRHLARAYLQQELDNVAKG